MMSIFALGDYTMRSSIHICFKFSCDLGISYIAAPLKHCLFFKSFRKMWKGDSLSENQIHFIPFNLSNRHWTLLSVNLKTKTLYILDPLKQHADADLVSKASIITNIILEKKFGYSKGCSIASMPHFYKNMLFVVMYFHLTMHRK